MVVFAARTDARRDLKIPKGASLEEIKKFWRQQVLLLHPDKASQADKPMMEEVRHVMHGVILTLPASLETHCCCACFFAHVLKE
jgi:hypothetical protein